MDDVFIFANPIAGRGKGRTTAERLARRLTAAGLRPRIFFERAEHLESLALQNLPDVKCAIVIGGDGTLRGVVDRLTREHAAVPPLLVVPFGTANLMGRHLGLKWTDGTLEDDVLAAIRQNKILRLDAARANGKLFLLMAGIGIDAKVVHQLDKMRRGPISKISYAIPAAFALSTYRYPPITVQVDGQTVFDDRPAIAMVGNIPEYGTGFPLLPSARPDDGLLDVCVMPCSSPQDLLPLFLHAAAGEHLTLEGVVYAKGKSIQVISPDQVPVQVDGDSAGFTPLSIELLRDRVPFLLQR